MMYHRLHFRFILLIFFHSLQYPHPLFQRIFVLYYSRSFISCLLFFLSFSSSLFLFTGREVHEKFIIRLQGESGQKRRLSDEHFVLLVNDFGVLFRFLSLSKYDRFLAKISHFLVIFLNSAANLF
uniref:Uncharacterized protein n=1 Tax=Cacopsylla melanoneura TaxID=428564 RepID=A0A8D8VL09_9HEMI